MKWAIEFHDEFEPEFFALPLEVRRTILLVAGDKSGGGARRFYRTLLRKADERFDRHLAKLAKEGES